MASVPTATSGLSYLTQPGGLLSNLPSGITAADLQKAPASDVVALSNAALEAQQVDGLFGISQQTASTLQLPVLDANPTASSTGSQILPGVSSADLNSATAAQQYTINNQALALQQTQELFGSTPAAPVSFVG
jgi:hypothetical protein